MPIASSRVEYFSRLLNAPDASLTDYMQFWYPERRQSITNDDFINHCNLSKTCLEDTAYSWGSRQKLLNIRNTLVDGRLWTGEPNPGHNVFTAFSAVATYGYGDIPIRIKFKAGTKLPAFFHQQYWLHDSSLIESWSYATPEHYDEIVRDLKRYASNESWYGFNPVDDPQYYQPLPLHPHRSSGLFDSPNIPLDDHVFTQQALKRSLKIMIKMILNGEGRIIYAAGVCRNREKAFETNFPTYINPFQQLQN